MTDYLHNIFVFRPHRLSLKASLSIGVAAVVFASTVALTTGALQLVKNRMRASIAAEEMTRIANIAAAVDQNFRSRALLLQTFGDSIESQGFQDAAQIQAFLEKHPSLKQAFANVAVMDLEGNLIANLNGAQQIGRVNVKDRDYFQRTLAGNIGVISDVYRNRLNGLAQVAITEPLVDTSTGRIKFVMSGAINLQDRDILGLLADMKFGDTGYLFISTTDGVYVSHPLSARILHNMREYGDDKSVFQLGSKGSEGSTEGIDEAGHAALFSFKKIRSTNWVVGATYPQKEAFAPIEEIERVTWIAALLFGGAAGALALAMVRRHMRPLDKLHEHMRSAQSRPTAVASSAGLTGYGDDEIGEMARTFDRVMVDRNEFEQSLARSEARVRTIADNIPAVVTYVDTSLIYTFVNAHVRGVLNGETFVGKSMPESRGAADFALVEPYYRRALAGESCNFEKPGDAAHGRGGRIFKAHYTPDFDAQGVVRGVFAMTFDITDEAKLRQALTQQERRLRDVTDNMPALVGYFDRDQNCLYGNNLARRMAGVTEGSMVNVTLRSSLGEAVYAQVEPHLDEVMAGRPVQFNVQAPLRNREGHFQANIVPDLDQNNEVLGFYLMSFNVTSLKEVQLRLAESELRLRTISDNMPALITYIDRDENITFVNATSNAWLGQTPSEVVGRHIAEVSGREVYAERKPMLERALAGERVEFETSTQSPGHDRVTQVIYVPDTRADGVTYGIFSLALDITRLKVVEQQLFELARIDTLTRLPNRLAFNEYLPSAVERARQHGASIALMFLDVDRFKEINDTHGHAHGDSVLIEYARRLQANVRGTDQVARLAGDEFVLVLENINSHDALATVAAKIVEQINVSSFIVEGTPVAVTTSIGIAYQRAGDAAISSAELLARADAALYNAKAAGRNRYAFFFAGKLIASSAVDVKPSHSYQLPHLEGTAVVLPGLRPASISMPGSDHELARLSENIQDFDTNQTDQITGHPALPQPTLDLDTSNNDFTIAFQPIVDVTRREIFAYEALVRGLHGESAPEVLGSVNPQNRFAFHEACRVRAIEMAAALGMQTRLSLNIAPNDICRRADCFETAMRVATACGFPLQRLMFEVTEGERVVDLPALAEGFSKYKQYGFTSALDDFGAGYSNFEVLAAFQPDVIKIDMSLVRDIHQKKVQFAIVEGLLDTCNALQIRVIAEGVETQEELIALRGLGVTLFQGYLFAKPAIGELPSVTWGSREYF